MGKKLLRSIVNNFGLKVLAFGFAFLLWLLVYNTNDPYITKNFTTTVTIKNAEALSEMHKCYEFVNNNNSVSFTVTAKRSYMEKLIDNDFVAVADLNNIIIAEDGKSATVRIDISSERYNSVLKYSVKNQYLELALDDLTSKPFQINASTYGELDNGYAIGSVEVTSPRSLRVSGPQSIVSTISSVQARIDIEGACFDITEKVVPILYDKDGNEIDTTKLTLSHDVVEVTAKILNTKELKLNFSVSGSPAGDNSVLEVTSDPQTVKVKGASSELNKYSSIDIPSEILNVTGATEDVVKTIDIREYLPEGIELVSKEDANIVVTVKIKAYGEKKLVVSTDKIVLEGMKDEYEYEFAASTFSVEVYGEETALESIDASNIKGSIDVSELEEGKGIFEVTLNLDEDTFSWKKVKVKVIARVKKEETNNSEEDTTSSSTDNDDGDSKVKIEE